MAGAGGMTGTAAWRLGSAEGRLDQRPANIW